MFTPRTESFKLVPFLTSNIKLVSASGHERHLQKTFRTLSLGGRKSTCRCISAPPSPSFFTPFPKLSIGTLAFESKVVRASLLQNYEDLNRATYGDIRELSYNNGRTEGNGPLSPEEGENGNGIARGESPGGGRKRRTLDQVVYHLQADLRRKRRIHRAEIKNAVELVEAALRVETFGPFLLNCCCDIVPDLPPTVRISLAQRIWSVIQKSKEYSLGTFEAMLKALALNEDKTSDPFTFLDEAKEAGIEVSGTMYFFALLIVCQRGDIEGAVKVLSLMKDNNESVNEKFFNVLIIGNARRGDIKGAEEILEIMKASQIDPSKQTWTSLLQAYIEAGKEDLVEKTFSEIVQAKLEEDQFYELLKATGRQSNQNILDSVIGWALESRKMHYLSIVNVCVQLMHDGHHDNALKIVFKFRNALVAKKEPFGAFFIKELHATNVDPEKFVSLVMSFQGEDRNYFALNMAAETCLKHKKLHLAFAVFEGMQVMGVPIRPHYFIPALLIETELNGVNGAVKVLQKMKSVNIQPDWDFLYNWIIPKVSSVEDNLMEVLRIVHEASGLSYSSGILSAGLSTAIGLGRIDDAVRMIDTLKGKIVHPEVVMQKLVSYITAIEDGEEMSQHSSGKNVTAVSKIIEYVTKNLPANDKTDYVGSFLLKLLAAESILKILNEKEISVSQEAAEIINKRIAETSVKVDPNLKHLQGPNGVYKMHPNEMDVTQLECHKEELEAKKLNARGTYRKLMLMYCQKGDFQKAVEVQEQFQEEFGELSPGMKSALMGVYVKNKLLKPALELYHDLAQTDGGTAEVDTYKLIDLAKLLIEKGCIDEGIKLIETECVTRTVHRPEAINRNIVRLLQTLSSVQCSCKEKQFDDNVFKLTELFLAAGLITPTNPALGPSVKDLITRGELEEAVSRFEMYSKKYNLTPCLQELAYATLNNSTLLDRVMKCSAATRGLRESKRLLALAKSDVGDLDGAAAIFRELGDRLSFVSLLKQCEYLASRHEVDKLVNLITSLHKTGQNYDCKKLYDIATRSCQRTGDQDGLKKILLSMEENDQYVPQALKELAVQPSR